MMPIFYLVQSDQQIVAHHLDVSYRSAFLHKNLNSKVCGPAQGSHLDEFISLNVGKYILQSSIEGTYPWLKMMYGRCIGWFGHIQCRPTKTSVSHSQGKGVEPSKIRSRWNRMIHSNKFKIMPISMEIQASIDTWYVNFFRKEKTRTISINKQFIKTEEVHNLGTVSIINQLELVDQHINCHILY